MVNKAPKRLPKETGFGTRRIKTGGAHIIGRGIRETKNIREFEPESGINKIKKPRTTIGV